MIIYKATNLINNKVYIGQTHNSLEHRRNQHFREANCSKRKHGAFHQALNKYGFDQFVFEIIDIAQSQEELDEKERYWIRYYNSTDKDKGYNLDSGGRQGGYKSEETKRKIGETTKLKWANEETAARMREGLAKGTETMKRNAKKYPFTCPVCNQTFYYYKYITEKKKYCSLQCAGEAGVWVRGVQRSGEVSHEKNIARKKIIRASIVQWVKENVELVLNCPKNKINNTLSGLHELLLEQYGIQDFRSIFICFDEVTNFKSLLNTLQQIAHVSKENIC